MELKAFEKYRNGPSIYRNGPSISYWRMASGLEVDFILGDGQIAIEVKSGDTITRGHLKGLRAWKEDNPHSRCMVVTRLPQARMTEDGIEILPWRCFLDRLWSGEFAFF